MTRIIQVIFLVFMNLKSSISTEYVRRNLATSAVENETDKLSIEQRPKMHTFFTPISEDPDIELLSAWKKAWYDAGWNPVVLTLEDAKRHRNYKRFIDAFEQAEYKTNDFDRLCFLRWLAMGTLEKGGWMSDYDMFPLYSKAREEGMELPNNGDLTCHSRHVPNLVSGSNLEWNRMSDLIFLSYTLHQDEYWSDMLALLEIHEKVDGYIFNEDSAPLESFYLKELSGDGIRRPFALGPKCKEIAKKRALHFSSADCKRVGFCDKKRKRAYEWLQAWKEKCNPQII